MKNKIFIKSTVTFWFISKDKQDRLVRFNVPGSRYFNPRNKNDGIESLNGAWIYLAFKHSDLKNPIYIGETANPWNRAREHISSGIPEGSVFLSFEIGTTFKNKTDDLEKISRKDFMKQIVRLVEKETATCFHGQGVFDYSYLKKPEYHTTSRIESLRIFAKVCADEIFQQRAKQHMKDIKKCIKTSGIEFKHGSTIDKKPLPKSNNILSEYTKNGGTNILYKYRLSPFVEGEYKFIPVQKGASALKKIEIFRKTYFKKIDAAVENREGNWFTRVIRHQICQEYRKLEKKSLTDGVTIEFYLRNIPLPSKFSDKS